MSYKVSAVDLSALRLNEPDPIASVLQNISVILRTQQGTVPMYREFGLPMKFLDKPIPVAKPMLYIEAKEAIELYEPRATVLDVFFTEDPSAPGKLIPAVEVEISE